jgi:hypothetical protein
MQPRLAAWAPLLDTRNINHGLLLPILLHCVDDQGHPLLGPTRKGPETKEFLREAHTDIPAVVEAMRQYWMSPACRSVRANGRRIAVHVPEELVPEIQRSPENGRALRICCNRRHRDMSRR